MLETKNCKSGFLAVRLHYSIDPALWSPNRIAAIRSAIPGWRWLKEYEIDFSARGGQKVYDCFDPLVHVQTPPIALTACVKYKVIDHGRRNPTACLWFAEHKSSQTVYFYREYYRPDATIAEHCRTIRELEQQNETHLTLIDPSTHRRLDNATTTIADEYARCGIATTPADNNLATGIETVCQALLSAIARWSIAHSTLHYYFEKHAIPTRELPTLAQQRSVYFHPSMTNTIRELAQLSWDASADADSGKSLSERIANVDDHATDCVRYALMRPWSRPQNLRTNIRKL
ncbi:MAG: hypothetical protein WC975_07265 [Phycisphaerae bacterium]